MRRWEKLIPDRVSASGSTKKRKASPFPVALTHQRFDNDGGSVEGGLQRGAPQQKPLNAKSFSTPSAVIDNNHTFG